MVFQSMIVLDTSSTCGIILFGAWRKMNFMIYTRQVKNKIYKLISTIMNAVIYDTQHLFIISKLNGFWPPHNKASTMKRHNLWLEKNMLMHRQSRDNKQLIMKEIEEVLVRENSFNKTNYNLRHGLWKPKIIIKPSESNISIYIYRAIQILVD